MEENIIEINRKKRDVTGLIEKGTRYLNNSDYNQALHFFKRAVELRPKNKQALYSIADFYKTLGEPATASMYYSRVIENHPLDIETYLKRAIVRLNCGDYVNALSDVNMVIMYQGEKTEHLLLRADIYVSLELWEKSIHEYTTLYQNNQAKAEALLGRGYCHQSKGEYEKALRDFTEGITVTPNDYILYCHRSICNIRLDKIHAAITDADKSVELGEYPESYYCRALSYAASNQPQKALLDVKTTLDLDMDYELNLEKHFLNEPGFLSLQTSPRYKGLLENHFGVEIPGLADETIKQVEE